ncbi:MAG: hypothetical protein HY023_03580 [Chloroflexi bacterium]|nr:hypothetical protein [Chloroflexota bacterium]
MRLTELYLQHDPVRALEARRLGDRVTKTFGVLGWMKAGPSGKIVGVGGTIRALARIDIEARAYPLKQINGYELELARVEQLIRRLREIPVKDRVGKVPGLVPERADIILAGAMVVAGALRRAEADRIVVCSSGVRDGLFYQEFLKPADPPVIRNLRRFSVMNMGRIYGYDEAHADHVARLALSLFDALAARHGYGGPEREILWAGAQLADIGKLVEYHDFRRHSAYLIVNAGLSGYSHRETALIALLCLYDGKDKSVPDRFAGLFASGDVERLDRLTALLRLAEYLDRSRTQSLTGLRMRVVGGRARLRLNGRAADARVEHWEIRQNSDLFEKAFGCKLEVE